MHEIGLMVTPGGNGYEVVKVSDTTTLAQFVEQYNLFGRTISVDNVEIAPEDFKTTALSGVEEIWAIGGAKGA